MRERGQIPLEDLIEEEEIFLSKSDPELDLNDDKDFLYSKEQRHLKPPKKRAGNPKADTIAHEHITRSSRITSFRLPCRL